MAENTTQRRWQALCPNCGAPVEFASAASASAVCGFCRSTLLREGEALRKIGESAALFEDYSPLQLGAAGRYAGAPFNVLGRLQLRYAQGSWNEWHVSFDGGRSAWLAEDNGSFVLSFEAPLAEPAPALASLAVGQRLTLAGQAWELAALTETRVQAAEGELPHPPQPGRPFMVAELRNAQGEVGSLEYLDAAAPQWSVGRAVALADLAMSGLREASTQGLGSQSLPCPNCGAALAPTLGQSLSIVCAQCQSVVDLSAGAGADLAHYAQNTTGATGVGPQIPLGSSGRLSLGQEAPQPWQVVGYLERCDLPESGEDEQSFWREYLLFNRTQGFAFLVDAEDGWSLVRPLTGAPRPVSSATVEWQGKSFRQRWRYQAKNTHVLGEFYWRLQREERSEVTDYEGLGAARAELLSREQTGQELVWSHGRKLEAAEVMRAFGIERQARAAFQRDVGSPMDSGTLLRNIVVGMLVLAFGFALLRSCSNDDCAAYRDSYGAESAEYRQCLRASGGSGVRIGSGGGSFGGFGSGGGGHK